MVNRDTKEGDIAMQKLESIAFAKLFGTSVYETAILLSKIKHNFWYRCLEPEERDKLIIRILNRIDSEDLSKAGPEGKERWKKGWQENLDNFISNNYDIKELTPKYIRPNEPIRLFGDYVMPHDPNFELNFYTVLRDWLFRYLADVDAIYEFGCGPAHNLAALAKMFPEKELHGLEWVEAPLEIIKLLAKKYSYKVNGHLFDMFSPDEDLEVKPNSAFLTLTSVEQLGTNFEAFLQFMLRKSPAIVVQVDTFLELCDPNNLSDFLNLKHNLRRNYLSGYLTRLCELESEKKIEIIKTQKVECGGLYTSAYSYVIWKPI